MQQQAKPICCKSDDASLLALFFVLLLLKKKIFATIGNECRETLISHQNDQNVRHFRDCGNYMLILMKHDLELEFWTFTTTLRRYPHTVVEKKIQVEKSTRNVFWIYFEPIPKSPSPKMFGQFWRLNFYRKSYIGTFGSFLKLSLKSQSQTLVTL